MTVVDVRPELAGATADALRAELARQWGTEFGNYIADVDWSLMAQAALNAQLGHARHAIGDRGPFAEARAQLSQLISEKLDVEMEALGFLLHLLNEGWHPHGYAFMEQRNKLFNALVDALQCMRDAINDIDDAAVNRVAAVVEEMGAHREP